MDPYTVNSLLEQANRNRGTQHSSRRGFHMDHILELQLLVAALNALLPFRYTNQSLGSLIDFFNDGRNLQEIRRMQNQRKGQAVTRLISQNPSQAGDNDHIQPIRNHWHRTQEGNLQNFIRFKEKLNEILRRHVPI